VDFSSISTLKSQTTLATAVLESRARHQETRRIVSIDREPSPFLRPAAPEAATVSGDYVTNGVTCTRRSSSVGLRSCGHRRATQHVRPARIDDMMRIARISWPVLLEVPRVPPEFSEIYWCGGSTN